jgi:hypothetical protein
MTEETNQNKFSKRVLKVYYTQPPFRKRHPLIRLCGFYLAQLDFQIGDAIEVTTERGKIVITKASEQGV